MDNQDKDKKVRSRNRSNIIIVSLLVLSVIGNIILFSQMRSARDRVATDEVPRSMDASIGMARDLESTNMELDKYKGISARLDSLVDEGNRKISEQKAIIEKLSAEAKTSKDAARQLEAERDKLNALMSDYLERVDNLLATNEQLKSSNFALNRTVNRLQHEVTDLMVKVETGQELLADNIEVTPIKKNILGKYVETAMARRTEKIEVCFDVLENRIAKPGSRKLHVKMFAPGAIPVSEEYTGTGYVTYPEPKLIAVHTSDTVFNYRNAKQNICVEWKAPITYESGTYLVELYTGQHRMGVTAFTLR